MVGPIDPNWLKDAKTVCNFRFVWLWLNLVMVGSVVFTLTDWLLRLFKDSNGWLLGFLVGLKEV